MVQPGILKNSLEFLSCREVNGIKYSRADSNIKCDNNFYKYDILPVNISLIVLLGFLIPLIIGYLLIKGQKKGAISNIDFKRTYGILYLDLQPKNYYFEILNIPMVKKTYFTI